MIVDAEFVKAKPKAMSAVTRRRRIDAARRKGEALVTGKVADLFDRQYKWLKRELRRQNLRKRLVKVDGDLFKAYDDMDAWAEWETRFLGELKDVLNTSSSYIAQVESDFFVSGGYGKYTFDYSGTVNYYERITGHKIKDITEDMRQNVAKDVHDWFGTDKGLPELISGLGKYFSESRAKLIASTEMAFVSSAVSDSAMDYYGIPGWFWDAILDYATCPICADLHGKRFDRGEPMPPDITHPACRCGILYDMPGYEPQPAGVEGFGEEGAPDLGGVPEDVGAQVEDPTADRNFRQFDDFGAADMALRDSGWANWVRTFSTEEFSAYEHYTTTLYRMMNEFLRGAIHPDSQNMLTDLQGRRTSPMYIVNRWIADLRTTLSRYAGLPEDIMVYRVDNKGELGPLIRDGKLTVGDSYANPGFLSTTTREDYAKDGFAHPNADMVFLEIKAYKGAPGAWLDTRLSSYSTEAEVLFNTDTPIHITSIEYTWKDGLKVPIVKGWIGAQ